jgi:N-acetylglucosaminyldiphosphoundecaprenol N-acetyl-beta-D-mannosaminyltransferase
MWELANRAQERGWRVFLLGGKPDSISAEVAEKLKAIYPLIKIVGTYGGTVKEEGIVERVAKTKPDILFVAFGGSKQEIFIHKNLKELGAKVTIGVGGSFNFIVGKAKRAPAIFQKLGIEWVWRFAQQPKRAGRIFNAFPRFVWEVWKKG